jgi:hypothetical protein
MSRLHILNGGATEATFKLTDIPGKTLVWQEDLMTGATPQRRSTDEWLSLRAAELSRAFDLEISELREDLARQEEKLNESLTADEVVLWFEYDLFCQVNLIYLLHWYGRCMKGSMRLDVLPFSDVLEKGLGTLEPADLEDLFKHRQEVSGNILKVGSKAWTAYSSSEPSEVLNLLSMDTSALPPLRRALMNHLARFPSIENGLGKVENRMLRLIAGGKNSFRDLFPAFWAVESAYGYGDTAFFVALKRLVDCREPLVTSSISSDGIVRNGAFLSATFELTAAGVEVLAGRADHIELNGVDQWLGGAHLTDHVFWRWDEGRGELAARR